MRIEMSIARVPGEWSSCGGRSPLRQISLQQTRVDSLERAAELDAAFIDVRMTQQREHQVEGTRRLVVGVPRGEHAGEPRLLEQHPGRKPRGRYFVLHSLLLCGAPRMLQGPIGKVRGFDYLLEDLGRKATQGEPCFNCTGPFAQSPVSLCKSREQHRFVLAARHGNDRSLHALPVESLAVRPGRMTFGIAEVKRGRVERTGYVAPQRCQEIAPTGVEQCGRGGDPLALGNLIALPLQHGPRAKDNTVFVDEDFVPFPDQWTYLAGVKRIPASTVERVAADAERSGQVLGVRTSGLEEEEDTAAPWLIPPSRRSALAAPAVKEPVPTRVEATLAQRLFIRKAGLPSSLINALSRIAAFQNPDFYEKQRLRLSTARIPRIICRAEDFPRHVALPRGCVDDATALLQTLGATLEIDDQREDGHPIEHRFHGTLTELQEHAVRALRAHDIGVLVAPPGVGKTVAGIRMIAERARNTLVLVHLRPLLEQWVAQLAMFLDVDPRTIGRIGDGKRRATGVIDVATFQSLVRGGTVADLVAGYGHVVVDECHHVAAASFEQLLSEVRARYVTGLTATPKRRDGQHPIFEMQLGPARYAVDRRSSLATSPFARRLVVRETEFELTGETDLPIQRIYSSLAGDARRNDDILNDVIGALDAGRSPPVLTERKDHRDFLAGRLRAFTRHLIVLQGGVGAKKRREALAAVAAIPDSEEFLVLATGRYIGEGFDDARLDTLFLTMPVSWLGTVVQYTGRLHRLHPDKTEVRIYDYVDRRVPVLARMYKRRLTGYRAIGYAPSEETML